MLIMDGTEKERLTEFRVELDDTPENRQKVAGAFRALNNLMFSGKDISFGIGIVPENGKIVLEAGFNNPKQEAELQKLLK